MAEDIIDVIAPYVVDAASTAVGYGGYGAYRVGQATYNYLRATEAPTNPKENKDVLMDLVEESAEDVDMAPYPAATAEEMYATPKMAQKVRDRLNHFSVTRTNHTFGENPNLKRQKYFSARAAAIGHYYALKKNVPKKRWSKKKKTFYNYKKSR